MKIDHNVDMCTFFLLDDEGHEVGHITYRIDSEDELRATHTKVQPGHNGRGYAGLLLDALADYAKSQDAKIVPVCSYVEQSFDKNPERYASVRK